VCVYVCMCVCSIGYGDILPVNSTEQLVCTLLMVLSGLFWANLVGDICGILATLDVNGIEFRQNMDQVLYV
jgi:hypothetical protein